MRVSKYFAERCSIIYNCVVLTPAVLVGCFVWMTRVIKRRVLLRIMTFLGILYLLTSISLSKTDIEQPETTPQGSTYWKNVTNLDKEQTLTVELVGRLGNSMFQLAFLYVQAKRHGLRMVLRSGPELNKLKEAFDTDFSQWEVNWPDDVFKEKFVRVDDKWDCAFDPDIILKPKGHILYYGFFQSWEYYAPHEGDLRRLFTFKQYYIDAAEDLLSKLTNVWRLQAHATEPLFIGMHVRRGDILSSSNFVEFGYRVADKAYLNNAIKHFEQIHPNALFVTCGNDYNWTSAYVKDYGNAVLVTGESEIADMVLLTRTRHTIMTTGTFGWWVSFLTNGITTYYKHAFTPGSMFAEQFKNNITNHLYKKWTGLE